MTTTAPLVGDYGLVPTYGNWRNRLAATLIRYGTNAPVNHAFLYIGGGNIIEAAPGGARPRPLTDYNPATITWSTDRLDINLSTRQRVNIAHAAIDMVGTPYGWADIIAIGLAQKRAGRLVDGDEWWVKRVQSTHTLICSQLVDLAYEDAGVNLFTDGRLPGLVSPGDLYRRLAPAVDNTERNAA